MVATLLCHAAAAAMNINERSPLHEHLLDSASYSNPLPQRAVLLDWSVDEVASWMNHVVGLPQYTPSIHAYRIDGITLSEMSVSDFVNYFPVEAPADVATIQRHLRELRRECRCLDEAEAEALHQLHTAYRTTVAQETEARGSFWAQVRRHQRRTMLLSFGSVGFSRLALLVSYFFYPELYEAVVTSSPPGGAKAAEQRWVDALVWGEQRLEAMEARREVEVDEARDPTTAAGIAGPASSGSVEPPQAEAAANAHYYQLLPDAAQSPSRRHRVWALSFWAALLLAPNFYLALLALWNVSLSFVVMPVAVFFFVCREMEELWMVYHLVKRNGALGSIPVKDWWNTLGETDVLLPLSLCALAGFCAGFLPVLLCDILVVALTILVLLWSIGWLGEFYFSETYKNEKSKEARGKAQDGDVCFTNTHTHTTYVHTPYAIILISRSCSRVAWALAEYQRGMFLLIFFFCPLVLHFCFWEIYTSRRPSNQRSKQTINTPNTEKRYYLQSAVESEDSSIKSPINTHTHTHKALFLSIRVMNLGWLSSGHRKAMCTTRTLLLLGLLCLFFLVSREVLATSALPTQEDDVRPLRGPPLPPRTQDWTTEHVALWVKEKVGFPEYVPYVLKHGIDGLTLMEMTGSDFEAYFPVSSPLHAMKLQAHVKHLRKQCVCRGSTAEAQQRNDVRHHLSLWGHIRENKRRTLFVGFTATHFPRVGMLLTYAFYPEVYQRIVGVSWWAPEDDLNAASAAATPYSTSNFFVNGGSPMPDLLQEVVPGVVAPAPPAPSPAPATRPASKLKLVGFWLAFLIAPDFWAAFYALKYVAASYFAMPIFALHFFIQGVAEYEFLLSLLRGNGLGAEPLWKILWNMHGFDFIIPLIGLVCSFLPAVVGYVAVVGLTVLTALSFLTIVVAVAVAFFSSEEQKKKKEKEEEKGEGQGGDRTNNQQQTSTTAKGKGEKEKGQEEHHASHPDRRSAAATVGSAGGETGVHQRSKGKATTTRAPLNTNTDEARGGDNGKISEGSQGFYPPPLPPPPPLSPAKQDKKEE
eukprot:gene11651-8034_t